MRKRYLKVLTIVGTVLILASCANQSTRTPSPEISRPTSTNMSTDPGRDQAVWFSYTKSGGFAGDYATLRILYNGTVIVDNTNGAKNPSKIYKFTLTEEELNSLKEAIQTADLPDEDVTYVSNGADMFNYTLIMDGHSVEADDGSIPQSLAPLFGMLNSYFQKADQNVATPTPTTTISVPPPTIDPTPTKIITVEP